VNGVSQHQADAGQVAAEEAARQAEEAARQTEETAGQAAETTQQETEPIASDVPDQEPEPVESAQTASSGDSAAGDEQAEANPLQAELDAAKQQAEEFRQRWLRAQADFDNFRRRTRLEKEDMLKYASMGLIGQLLPVVDNFERAIAASESSRDFDALFKGLEMIYKQLMQVLEQEGLKPIEAVGQPFNPEYHQAVMQVQSEEHGEGIVVDELQKGYMLKEKVLRPSMVSVNS
jgi:molecular chaperone GrpE